MPRYVFDVTHGCGCKEDFQCDLDLEESPLEYVPRSAFDQAKKAYIRRWCGKCKPKPGRRRVATRRNVRSADTDAEPQFDPDADVSLGFEENP